MSNEPLYSEKQPNEPAGVTPSADSAFDADAELVLAALGRMETAIRGDRATLARLRAALSETASVISEAKRALHAGAIKPDAATEGKDFGALLDDLEHRIDTAIELAGGARHAPPQNPIEPAEPAEPSAQSMDEERVPTVSSVVSRLNRGSETDQAEPQQATDVTGLPTVSMLQAMVEALHVEATPAQVDVENSPPDAVEIKAPEQTSAPDPSPAEPAEPVQSAVPANPIPPESELLASVAQLQSLPMMPPEVGAAVIFARTEPAPPQPPPTAIPEPEAQALPEVAAIQEMPAEPAAALSGEASTEVDLEGDLDAFLFGPDAARADEPPPAERPIQSAGLPAVDLIAPLDTGPERTEPAAGEPSAETPSVETAAWTPPVAEPEREQPPAPDPLAPLKAMTANERLAIFS